MEVSDQLHATATLVPGKEPLVPTGWEDGWAPEPVWNRCRREKFSVSAYNRTPVVQPVAWYCIEYVYFSNGFFVILNILRSPDVHLLLTAKLAAADVLHKVEVSASVFL
jgi:hypothetical protein